MTWTIEPHGNGYALYSGRDDMRHGMNLVYLSDPDANWEKTKALIEAAPDMLDILQRLLDIPNDDLEFAFGAWETAREIVAKARGEK